MSDKDDDEVWVATEGNVWHPIRSEDDDGPSCRQSTDNDRYRRLRAEIGQSWYKKCSYCDDQYIDRSGVQADYPQTFIGGTDD